MAPLVMGLGVGPAAATPQFRPPAADEDDTPLSVTLTAMTPSEIPRKGAITLEGVVTNASEEQWTDINVFPFIAQEPITSRDELAEAAETAPDTAVGDRLTDPGPTRRWRSSRPATVRRSLLRMPVSSLPISGDPGVYWIGVHALGTSTEGRDANADGRARTFIPLVPPEVARRRTVPVSVVLPLRDRARRDADGSLNGPARWVNLTRPDGRLTRLADFGASAGNAPVSWLVDVAVLDALSDFANGNPPLSLGPAQRADEGGRTTTPAAPTPAPRTVTRRRSPVRVPPRVPSPPGPDSPDAATRERTRSVLETFLSSTRKDPVLAVGYADPDVAALARLRPSLLRRSDDLAARRMVAWGLNGRPTVAPRNGYFDPDLLTEIPRDSLMLLTDRGRLQTPVLSNLPSGQQLLMSDERAVDRWPRSHRCPGPTRVAPAGAVGGRTGGDQGRRDTPPGRARHPGHLEPRAALARGRLLRRPGDLVAADRTPAHEQHHPDVRRRARLRVRAAGQGARPLERRRDPHPDAHERGARPAARQRQHRDRASDRGRAAGVVPQRPADAEARRRPGPRARRHHARADGGRRGDRARTSSRSREAPAH